LCFGATRFCFTWHINEKQEHVVTDPRVLTSGKLTLPGGI
jgi:hypothetical protein